MADRLVALPGCLVGSWRGIPFHVPDISTSAGRRLVTFDLPGTDITIFEDLGRANGPIRVAGLIVGDDASAQAAAIEAACNTPGPGTLVHPWLGPIMVVLAEPADIRFDAQRLRCFTFHASFLRWTGGGATASSTLALIGDAAGALADIAGSLLDAADGLIGDGLASVMGSVWETGLDALGGAIAGADLIGALSSATFGGTLSLTDAAAAIGDAVDAGAWMTAAFGAAAKAGTPPASPAIGAGPTGRAASATVDPWSTVAALLDTAKVLAVTSTSVDTEGDALVWVAAATTSLAVIADPLAAVAWESRQQAEAARARISTAIGAVASAAITTIDTSTDAAAERQAAWRALGLLRRRIHEDLDDRIGRLPSVMTITPPTRVNVWIVAQYVAGDSPKAVREAFEDIVKRNRIAHPALIPDASIEVLPPRGVR